MNRLRFGLRVVLHILRVLTFQWALDGADVIKRFVVAMRKLCAFLKMPHAEGEEKGKDWCKIDHPSFHRPDPCIYSQQYLLGLGLPVTWDNPDIVVRRNGVIVSEHDLLPDTEYEIGATIWNNSYEAPAVGLKVFFSFLSFGVGTVSTAIGTDFLNLGVKGGPNHPADARMQWRTPPVPGHYCLQVLLVWLDDANQANNLGQNNLDVVAPHSPAPFSFRLRNSTGKPATYAFQVDTYTIPPPEACKTAIGPADRGTFAERLRRTKARHNRDDYPVPAGWSVDILPLQPTLQPDEEIDIAVNITSPAGFSGNQPFNVSAMIGSAYAGGVSLVVATQ